MPAISGSLWIMVVCEKVFPAIAIQKNITKVFFIKNIIKSKVKNQK
jgi:hypothetical protein